MAKKNLFSDYQKKMMAEYLDNQFDLYLKLQSRALDLYLKAPYKSERELKALRLAHSFCGKMNYIANQQYKEWMR